MRLLTLGGLGVEGTAYRREKPLLLLAYLALEGTQTRKHLAELFWPEAANSMNSLAQNLIRLRPLGEVVREHDKWVEAQVQCDAADFRTHHKAGRTFEATSAYRGAFLDGVREGLNADLEEWLLDTRTALGAEARAAWLTVAEAHHARNEPADAARHAERAYTVPGADPIDPEDIPRVWRLLGRTDHPLAVALRREAAELGLSLPAAPEPAPVPVSILGRQAELEQLRALAAGQVAWISGPPGIGKSALLGALAAGGGWRVLPGVNGLPLGTLEPLSPHPLTGTADAVGTLRDTRLKLAIDGWEDCDDTTRAALTLAARQHPGATLVIAARQPPAVPVAQHLPLHPLSEAELEAQPGAHAATGGHPTLLSAFLSGTPADRSLDAHLTHLGHTPRRLFLALAAQDTPHLNATRAALNLSAGELAGTLDQLTREGLTTPTGSIRATTPARDLLDAQPLDTALLHLHLARAHPKDSAWPHWLKAKDLWEGKDEAACAAAAHWYADQEMKRGYPAKAARTLEVAPQTDEVKLLWGWAFIKMGRLTAAADFYSEHPVSSNSYWKMQSLVSICQMRLGNFDIAQQIANSIPARMGIWSGHAMFAIGGCLLRLGQLLNSLKALKRAALYYKSEGEEGMAIQSECLIATIKSKLGEHPDLVFSKVIIRSAQFPIERANILVNYADCLLDSPNGVSFDAADILYAEAVGLYISAENYDGSASALNSWGVSAHIAGRHIRAVECYQKALEISQGTGNMRLLTLINANMAEINLDYEEFKDSIFTLESIGYRNLAEIVSDGQLAFKERPAILLEE